MVPLVALLLFAGQLSAAPPAPLSVAHDFRLVGRDGLRSGLIDINAVSTDAAGRVRATLYFIYEDEPLGVGVVDMAFDCQTSMVSRLRVRELNRALEFISDTPGSTDSQVPESGSIYGLALDMMCRSRNWRGGYPGLGSDLRAAIRAADARFR